MRLDIEIFADKKCVLEAYDNTVYQETGDTVKYAFVEFVCYYAYANDENNLLAIDNSKKTTYLANDSAYTDRLYQYTLQKDGRFRYYKYGLYTITNPVIYNGLQYNIQGKIFYDNGKVYYGTANTVEPVFNSSNSIIINNWYKIKDYMSAGIDYWFDSELFTICHLNQCLIALQKQAIFDGLKNCNFGACEKDKQIKMLRDFLFISVYVLDYLMSIGNYTEAQRIIESLATCGGLCDEQMRLSSNNCNCK